MRLTRRCQLVSNNVVYFGGRKEVTNGVIIVRIDVQILQSYFLIELKLNFEDLHREKKPKFT